MSAIKSRDVNLLFIDKKEMFEARMEDKTIPSRVFKKCYCLEEAEELDESYLRKIFFENDTDDFLYQKEYLLVFIHAFQEDIHWKPKLESKIQMIRAQLPNLNLNVITIGNAFVVVKEIPNIIVLTYTDIKQRIDSKNINIQTIEEILTTNYNDANYAKDNSIKPLREVQYTFDNLNDWRLNGLDYVISRSKIKQILGTCFYGLTEVENFLLSIIDPGLSGAFLFKVSYMIGTTDYNKILKIKKVSDNNSLFIKEERVRKLINEVLETSKDKFITYIDSLSSRVDEYDCCVYDYVENSTTLEDYLYKNHTILSDVKLKKIIDMVFNNYDYRTSSKKNKWGVRILSDKPWHSVGREYAGLKIEDQYKNEMKGKIIKVLSLFSNEFLLLLFDIPDIAEIIKKILHFIDTDKWDYDIIDGNSNADVPISYVHGDFNAGNILVDRIDGLEPHFIDLSQLDNNKHALLDFGKLSVEMEKKVLPSFKLLENNIQLVSWVNAHENWLNGVKSSEADDISLQKVYFLNTLIREYIKTDTGKFNSQISSKELDRQFQMVRMHYFFRMIAQDHIIPHKRLFGVKAIVDILHYLTKTK